MLIVIPVHAGDLPLALLNIKLAAKLDASCPFAALISAPRGLDVSALEALAAKWFASTTTFRYDDWTGDKAWPRPQNWAWQSVARYIATLTPAPKCWFWWEADVTLLKSGAFPTLFDAYKAGGKPFCGQLLGMNPQGRFQTTGVALYPADVRRYSINSFLTRSTPFDCMLKEDIERECASLEGVVAHYYKPAGRPAAPLTPALVASLQERASFYHGSSDGALARYLLDGTALPAPPAVVRGATTPSFVSQTPWPSGYFSLPHTPHTVYFNCGVVDYRNSLYLFTRRWRYHLRDPHWAASGNSSDLVIFQLDSSMRPTGVPLIPALPRRSQLEQWEDPRVMLGTDNRLYASFGTWTHKQPWPFHQIFTRLSPDLRFIEAVDDIAYGGNGSLPRNGTAPEKNWTWFQHEGLWHCRYSINPSDVFVVRGGRAHTHWRQREVKLPWTHSAPLRGGTPSVRVGNEYISFFHSHLPWKEKRRRYFMGAVAFAATPPFALTRIVREPLLAGSEEDVMTLPNALPCIFPNGALLRSNEWLVTFGVNDEACGWIKIPHAALEERLMPIKRSRLAKLTASLC